MKKHTQRPLNLAVTAALLAVTSVSAHAATFSSLPFSTGMVDKMVAGSSVAAGGADTNQILLAGPSGTTGPLNLVKATAWGSSADTNAAVFGKISLTDQGIGLGAGPGTSPKHAIDNAGTREFVLFEFDQAVTLNALSISWIGADSDISIAAFTGAGDAEALLAGGGINSTNTGNNLAGGNWESLNIANAGTGSESFSHFETAGAGGTAVASKFWAIGAYNSGLGDTFSTGNDYVKISGLGGKYTTPCYPPGSPGCTPPGGGGGGSVPEPSSITLAALGLLGGIRRWKSRKA
ncbi:MAG: exosortase-dependent surface protein XDP1 [Gammaproteobacteria bacterium]